MYETLHRGACMDLPSRMNPVGATPLIKVRGVSKPGCLTSFSIERFSSLYACGISRGMMIAVTHSLLWSVALSICTASPLDTLKPAILNVTAFTRNHDSLVMNQSASLGANLDIFCSGEHFGFSPGMIDCGSAKESIAPDATPWLFGERHTGHGDDVFPLPFGLMGRTTPLLLCPLQAIARLVRIDHRLTSMCRERTVHGPGAHTRGYVEDGSCQFRADTESGRADYNAMCDEH